MSQQFVGVKAGRVIEQLMTANLDFLVEVGRPRKQRVIIVCQAGNYLL